MVRLPANSRTLLRTGTALSLGCKQRCFVADKKAPGKHSRHYRDDCNRHIRPTGMSVEKPARERWPDDARKAPGALGHAKCCALFVSWSQNRKQPEKRR